MYKIYFKQAIALLRQNPFISIVSIVGTALAIMMVMTMIVVREIKSTSVKPVSKSDRMLIAQSYVYKRTPKSTTSGDMDLEYAKLLYGLSTPEAVSLLSFFDCPVTAEGSSRTINPSVRLTDEKYWSMFDFEWIAGKPYGKEEVDAGISDAVITDKMARELFGKADPLGQTILMAFKRFRVVGVVKEIPYIFQFASSDMWIPYTTQDTRACTVILLAADKKDFPVIREEVRELEKKFAIDNDPQTLWFVGPLTKSQLNMNAWGHQPEEFENNMKRKYAVRYAAILVLLLIPAVNLAGFSLARMKKRTAEIGIRKAFGARRSIILIQVLYENLITSLIGGFIGLLLSYVVIYSFRAWLLSVSAGSAIPISTMFSLPIVLAVFLLCIFLNLLSAGIPAYRAARTSIVNSLNRNEQQRW